MQHQSNSNLVQIQINHQTPQQKINAKCRHARLPSDCDMISNELMVERLQRTWNPSIIKGGRCWATASFHLLWDGTSVRQGLPVGMRSSSSGRARKVTNGKIHWCTRPERRVQHQCPRGMRWRHRLAAATPYTRALARASTLAAAGNQARIERAIGSPAPRRHSCFGPTRCRAGALPAAAALPCFARHA